MGTKKISSHQDPPFLLWGRKEESRWAIVGVTDRGTPIIYTLGQGPSPRKNPSSTMGRTPPRSGVAEDKGNDLLLRVTLWVIPWNRISTKTKKDNGRNENI